MLLALIGFLAAAMLAQSAGAVQPVRPQTAASLPGAAYPWVQPLWRSAPTGVVVTGTTWTRTEQNAHVQPIFVRHHGFVVPTLR
jgi:hypothetical protein